VAEPTSQPSREFAARNHAAPPAAWLALVAVFLAVYVGSMFSPALLDDADATHAEAAREMAASGDFVTLHINGVRYLEKAPLLYWMVALSFKIFGAKAAAARLPIVLGVLAMALLAWRWSRRAFGEPAGSYAALFTMTAVGVFLFTRVLIPEVLLGVFIGTALYCFLTALEERAEPWRWYAGYVSMALAVLTKGLVALVIVSGTAVIYLAVSGDWRRWREFRLLTGTALLLAVAAPWHVMAGVQNPGFFWFYFVNEHLLRFLGRRYPADYNKLPAPAYWTLHLAWLFPWSAFAPALFRRDKRQSGLDFAARTRMLCWAWAGLVLLFFSFSTNQEYYTFPAYLPILILLGGAVAQRDETDAGSRSMMASYAVLLLVGVAAASVLMWGLWTSRNLPFVPDVGEVLVQRGVGNYTLSMSHFFDLTAESFAALRLPGMLAVAALLLGPLVGLVFRIQRKPQAAVWSVGLGMATLLVAAHMALVRFEPYLSSKPLADKIAAVARPEDQVMIYGDQAFGSSLLFYLRRQVFLVNGRSTSMEFGSRYADAPRIFLEDTDLQRAWQGPQRVFLFVPADRRKEVEVVLPGTRYVVGERSGKVVWSNREDD
jgi:4-amino-4-deoxy-L-arabinose transferase-like glycosyltransferase